MKILLDECLPRRLARSLPGHEVFSVRDMDWLGLSNGKLLAAADQQFEIFLTVDKNLVHQQKIETLRLAVIVFRAKTNKIEDLSPLIPQVLEALGTIRPGHVALVS